MKNEMEIKWLICPLCHHKTRLKLQNNTIIHNFPLFCPKCRQTTLINVKEFQIEMIH